MTSWRLAPSTSAPGCVANTCAPHLGPFASFTPLEINHKMLVELVTITHRWKSNQHNLCHKHLLIRIVRRNLYHPQYRSRITLLLPRFDRRLIRITVQNLKDVLAFLKKINYRNGNLPKTNVTRSRGTNGLGNLEVLWTHKTFPMMLN